jgi:hypothetical protein
MDSTPDLSGGETEQGGQEWGKNSTQGPEKSEAQGVKVTLRFGMREEDDAVVREITEEEMTELLWTRFQGAENREWRVRVEDDERNEQTWFGVEEGWRYTLEEMAHVELRRKGKVRYE